MQGHGPLGPSRRAGGVHAEGHSAPTRRVSTIREREPRFAGHLRRIRPPSRQRIADATQPAPTGFANHGRGIRIPGADGREAGCMFSDGGKLRRWSRHRPIRRSRLSTYVSRRGPIVDPTARLGKVSLGAGSRVTNEEELSGAAPPRWIVTLTRLAAAPTGAAPRTYLLTALSAFTWPWPYHELFDGPPWHVWGAPLSAAGKKA
jgi:hypothetical protein